MVSSCDTRGFLSFFILWSLSKKNMTGSEISRVMMLRKQTRLSPGTIYPALKMLRERGMISVVANGNKEKVYGLTNNGKGMLDNSCDQLCGIFYDFDEIREVSRKNNIKGI